jgi:hypothetical protein
MSTAKIKANPMADGTSYGGSINGNTFSCRRCYRRQCGYNHDNEGDDDNDDSNFTSSSHSLPPK